MSITEDASRDTAITTGVIALAGTLLLLGIGVGVTVGADETGTQTDDPIAIDDCTEIETAGEYELSSNLTNRSTCLEITASDVIVDGAGYGIGGYGLTETESPQYGIHANDTENVTVRNVSVAGWGSNASETSDAAAGIAFESVTDGTVANVTAFENENGVAFDNATRSMVTNVTATGNFAGVTLWDSNGNAVVNTTATENTDGIALWYSSGNAVTNNAVSGNYYNVVLGSAHWNTVVDTGANGGDYGVFLQSSHRNTVADATVNGTVYGIALDGSSGNTLSANTVSGSDSGIVLESSSRLNALTENELSGNAEGVSVTSSSHGTTLTENTVESGDWDLTIDNSTDTDVTALELGDETVSVDGENVRLRASGGGDVDAGVDDTPPAPPNHGAVGPAFELEATGGSSVVDLTTSYAGAGLGSVDEESIGFWRFDDESAAWERIDDSSVDPDNRTVSVSLGESEFTADSEADSGAENGSEGQSEGENGTGAETESENETVRIAAFGLEAADLNVSLEEDGEPVTNTTTVEVVDAETDGIVAIRTVSDGTASFALQNGTYDVTADARGHDPMTDTVTVDGDGADLALALEGESESEGEVDSGSETETEMENESTDERSDSLTKPSPTR
ncbi:NosD domain-containing protein [Halomontanus rarus]|uniref:NosD domain-containing protein n=1 Tax=Halomontanus rarus TaxID=3034020 RepID=UPI001A98D2F4